MSLADKLLGYLPRVFNKDPVRNLVLRLRVTSGTLSWKVDGERLTTVVSGGVAQPLDIDLTAYTISSLANFLLVQAGYDVPFFTESGLSARCLIDAAGDQDESNGDHLYAYMSLTWAYLHAMAAELINAKDQIAEMLAQMSVPTAQDEWLDLHGRDYYNVPREVSELNDLYATRIIAEVLSARGNNVAMEAAISALSGGLPVKILDVPTGSGFPTHDGTLSHNGAHNHISSSLPSFGLFDAEFTQDLASDMSIDGFRTYVLAVVERMRAAGTHLRQIKWNMAIGDDTVIPPVDGDMTLEVDVAMTDTLATPSEAFSAVDVVLSTALSDTASAPTEATELDITYAYTHSGLRLHDGSFTHSAGTTSESL